jgi:hypothetical protein
MNKRYKQMYIIYLMISSFFIEIERQSLLLHFLSILPTLFLLYVYFQYRPQPFEIEDYLVLTPLIIFPISETAIYLFSKTTNEPLMMLLNSIYFFVVHICFIIVYRMEGGRLLTFTNSDYYQIFPILIAIFLIFGFVFLPIIPDQFVFLMMLIATLLAFLLAHIINLPIKGKSYFYGLLGGALIATTDFFAAYNAFFLDDAKFYILYRLAYFIGLFCLIESLLSKPQIFALNSQKEFLAKHQ